MKKPKTRVRLSLYERGIVEALGKEYGYAAGEARELVADYIAVVRRLGGYEPCWTAPSAKDIRLPHGFSISPKSKEARLRIGASERRSFVIYGRCK